MEKKEYHRKVRKIIEKNWNDIKYLFVDDLFKEKRERYLEGLNNGYNHTSSLLYAYGKEKIDNEIKVNIIYSTKFLLTCIILFILFIFILFFPNNNENFRILKDIDDFKMPHSHLKVILEKYKLDKKNYSLKYIYIIKHGKIIYFGECLDFKIIKPHKEYFKNLLNDNVQINHNKTMVKIYLLKQVDHDGFQTNLLKFDTIIFLEKEIIYAITDEYINKRNLEILNESLKNE